MTPIVPARIDVGGEPRFVYLKLEAFGPWGSIKDRTARSLVTSLEAEGKLHPGSTIVESTSGNLGVALASLARTRGYRFVAVVDPKVSTGCLRAMRALGARIELVDSADRDGGYLGARLARVRELCEASLALVWPDQYTNPANPRAHELGPAARSWSRPGGGLTRSSSPSRPGAPWRA
jgi:N-(2-amino-2-carboxyethyl)-L-glutamate synthase